MPGKMIPVKGRGPKGVSKKPKGKGLPGDQYVPIPAKPTPNRLRFLEELNKMNNRGGY